MAYATTLLATSTFLELVVILEMDRRRPAQPSQMRRLLRLRLHEAALAGEGAVEVITTRLEVAVGGDGISTTEICSDASGRHHHQRHNDGAATLYATRAKRIEGMTDVH